jgi:hypothetical protein
VAEWHAAMSSHEFAEWAAYAQIEPFGPTRADLRTGILAALIAEVYRDRKKRAKPYSPAEFMPFLEADGERAELERPSPDALWTKLKAGLGLAGARDNGSSE